MLFRYSRWDGTQNLSDLDADDLLAAISDDLMSDGDLWSALRRMFQRGTQDPQGQRMPGIQDLRRNFGNQPLPASAFSASSAAAFFFRGSSLADASTDAPSATACRMIGFATRLKYPFALGVHHSRRSIFSALARTSASESCSVLCKASTPKRGWRGSARSFR